jgi:Rod binding domain-containing protein
MSELSVGIPVVRNETFTDARGAQALRNLKAPRQEGDSAKVQKAARDFEAVLIGKWLEQAEKSFATVPGDDPDKNQDPGHDQFQGMAMQSLAGELSKAGGLGIASMIVRGLKPAEPSVSSTGITEKK